MFYIYCCVSVVFLSLNVNEQDKELSIIRQLVFADPQVKRARARRPAVLPLYLQNCSLRLQQPIINQLP